MHKKIALHATLHCLFGCSVGEIIGMVIGTYFNIQNLESIIMSVILAFVFGYSFSLYPLLKNGLHPKKALPIALASDTVSISVMELMDNLVIVLIPGAINAGLKTLLFWESLTLSLIVAFISAFPVNLYLISKGKGQALTHSHH